MTSTLTPPATSTTATRRHAMTGMVRLLRLALRRDRFVLPAWLVALAAISSATVTSVTGAYTDEAQRRAAAVFSARNPIARAFNGPASGSDLGALAMTESFLIIAVLVAIMSIQTVVRHTRAEEEAGRAELLGSMVVGRHAPLATAVAVGMLASGAAGLAFTGVLVAAGLGAAGSVAAGSALAGVGSVFAAIAAVTAQLVSSARAATGAAIATLGLAFVLRAVGDSGGEVSADGTAVISAWPSWLSPLGWGHQVQAFHDTRWWVLGVFLVVTVTVSVVAAALRERRDLGAGLLASRRGPAEAPVTLRGVFGLAWRLQRGVLAAWVAGLSIVGASFGSVGESVDELVESNEPLATLLAALAPGGSLTETFFAFTIGLLGIIVSGFTVQSMLRLRSEEASGRLEPLLATATSRLRFMASHVAIAVGGTLVLLVAVGASTGAAYRVTAGGAGVEVLSIVGAALAQLPAALVLGGLVGAAFAVLPRIASAVGWTSVGAAFVIGQLGDALGLPSMVRNLSPFTHVPAVPAVELEVVAMVALGMVAVTLYVVGIIAFRRRDLAISA